MRSRFPLVLIAALGAAACSDSALAPNRALPDGKSPSAVLDRGRNDNDEVVDPTAATGFDIVIPRRGGTVTVGVFTLTFAKRAVSCVGVGDDCIPARGRVRLHATVGFSNGVYTLDVDRHVEFNPGSVTLSTGAFADAIAQLTDAGADAADTRWKAFAIMTNDLDAAPRATVIHTSTGTVERLIDHFTGFHVGSGIACDDAADPPDPTCIPSSVEIVLSP
jgi:hypothetical protein